MDSVAQSVNIIIGINEELERRVYEWLKLSFNTTDLQELIEEIKSDELSLQVHGAVGIRRLLSAGKVREGYFN